MESINFSVFVWCSNETNSCKTAAVCKGDVSGFSDVVINCIIIEGSREMRGAMDSFLAREL